MSIRLPANLPALTTWSPWDHRLAYAAVIPHLLAPNGGRRRARVRTVHYIALRERMGGQADSRATEILAYLDTRCSGREAELIKTSKFRSYQSRLKILATRGLYVRSVFTTGLVAKVLLSEHGVRDDRRVLDEAYQYIYDNYQTGEAILANDYDTRDAWFSRKSVAHLCAAFVDFALRSNSTAPWIDDAKLAELEDDMGSFLATAHVYQSLLAGSTELVPPLARQTLRSLKLRQLPVLQLGAQPYRPPELPNWDQRRSLPTKH